RLQLYRQTTPHPGFAILRNWAEHRPGGAFVYTSNVDGQFQKAVFEDEQIAECHGSIHYLQCCRPCSFTSWSAAETEVKVDLTTFHASPPLPRCRFCGRIARPNVLMFYDGQWVSQRSDAQEERLEDWLVCRKGARLVVVECGAGEAIPTVRL